MDTKNNSLGEDAGYASLDGTPGMGAPSYASRGVAGSGDAPSIERKKKRRKIRKFKDFNL